MAPNSALNLSSVTSSFSGASVCDFMVLQYLLQFVANEVFDISISSRVRIVNISPM